MAQVMRKKNGKIVERPKLWKVALNFPGLPDMIVQRVPVSCMVGGGGGATTLVGNGIKLNVLDGTLPSGSWVYRSTTVLQDNYRYYRVIGCNLRVQASAKAAAPTSVLVLASAETTNPASTVSLFSGLSDDRFAVRRTMSPSGGGKDVVNFTHTVHDLSDVAGPRLRYDDSFVGDNTTGSPAAPSTVLYLWCVAIPTNGGSFTAATDPVFTVTGDIVVEWFTRQQ